MQRKTRTFYTLIITQTFSLIGSRISGLALGIWIFQQTGQATPLALVSFFATLPVLLASSVSGVLADRWDRRKVMLIADAGQAFGTVLLLISVASNSFEVWHLYVVTFIQAIFGVFQNPAFGASVSMLIEDDQRDRANVVMQMSGPAAGIIAPAFAGIIYSTVGVTGAIVVDLLTFLTAMAVLFAVHIPNPAATAEGRALRGTVWQEILGGLRYLNTRRMLLYMLLYISLLNFLITIVINVTTPYLLTRTGSEQVTGLLLGLFNLGGLTGGIVFGVWGGTRPRIHTIMPALLMTSAGMIFIGIGQTPLILATAMFFAFLPLPMVNAAFMSIMQLKVAPDVQGRVFALIGQISMALLPVSALLSGPLADRVFEPAVSQPGWQIVAPLVGYEAGAGIGLMFVVVGLVMVTLTAFVYALPAMRRLEATLPDFVPTPAPGNAPEGDAQTLPESV